MDGGSAAGEIRVLVTDRETGDPVVAAHAAVFLIREGGEGASPFDREVTLLQGATDAGGLCVLRAEVGDGDPPTVQPVVRARGRREWRAPQLHGGRHGEGEVPPAPALAPGGTARFEVTLERGRTLRGTVTDPSGGPVPGARIGLVLSYPFGCSWPYAFGASHTVHWPPPCRADERGRFEWLSFPEEAAHPLSGGHFVLTAEHPDFVPGMVHNVESLPADDGGEIEVPVVLAPGRELDGEVLLPDGAPAEGARVVLDAPPRQGQPFCVRFSKVAAADAGGRFSFRGLGSGVHRVAVVRDGCAPGAASVEIRDGVSPPSLRIRLEAGSVLEGTVRSRAGRPVPGAFVSVFDRDRSVVRQATTDAEGRFRVGGLPRRGRVEVLVSPFFRQSVSLPSPPLEIREPAGADLRVVLVARESGEPLGTDGTVFADGPGFSTTLRPGSDGVFERPGAPPGRYELWADVSGRAVARKSIRLPEAGLPSPVVLRVPRGGAVRGRVHDPRGKPLRGVAVTACGRSLRDRRGAMTDEEGNFELSGLGPWTLLVFQADGYALRTRSVLRLPVPGAARTRILELEMHEGATVTGRVVRADGSPVPRALVRAVLRRVIPLPVDPPSTLTDDGGRFTLLHVPAGRSLVATDGARARVRTRDGACAEVVLEVP